MLDTPLDTDADGRALSQRELAGMLDWWREAGVDCSFADAAEGWLDFPEQSEEKAPVAPKVEAPRPTTPLQRALKGAERSAIGGPREAWPQELEAFERFWMTEPSIAEGALSARVPPRGDTDAQLMVLVPQPEDGDNERLLGGPPGSLVASFLRAAGLSESEVYCASALPRTLPLPDWSDLARRGLDDLTRHHIALAKPQRVLVFGRGLLPLFSRDETVPSTLDLPDGSVPLMIAPRLDRLLRMPGHRKHFWKQWLDWTA